MKKNKWIVCRSGWHMWHEVFKEESKLCCRETYPIRDNQRPWYICKTGNHKWKKEEEGVKCCNGYIPIWEEHFNKKTNKVFMRVLTLVPISRMFDLDDKASNPEDLEHLKQAN
jgi:hypothetical protein